MLALRRFTEGVSPEGSTWSVLEIPNCVNRNCNGGKTFHLADGSPPHPSVKDGGDGFQFPPRSPGLWSGELGNMYKNGISPGTGKGAKWTYNDNVKVPSDLPAGRYVLGWRW